MDWISACMGLLGAIIGGGASLWATKLQLNAQETNSKQEKDKEKENVEKIISAFLMHEVETNLSEIKGIADNFEYEYGNNKLKSVGVSRNVQFNEYEKVKYKLLEINTPNSLKIIDLYQMFSMFVGRKDRPHLSHFKKEEYNFITSMYKEGNKITKEYYENKYK